MVKLLDGVVVTRMWKISYENMEYVLGVDPLTLSTVYLLDAFYRQVLCRKIGNSRRLQWFSADKKQLVPVAQGKLDREQKPIRGPDRKVSAVRSIRMYDKFVYISHL